ncbi:hypothetical protein, partial [Natrinema soli]
MRREDRSRSDPRITRRTALKTGALISTGLFLGTVSAGIGAAGEDDPPSIVGEMTLEEKVSRTHGADGGPEGIAGYLQGVERLDVPGMGMADSPAGVVAADP